MNSIFYFFYLAKCIFHFFSNNFINPIQVICTHSTKAKFINQIHTYHMYCLFKRNVAMWFLHNIIFYDPVDLHWAHNLMALNDPAGEGPNFSRISHILWIWLYKNNTFFIKQYYF